MIRASGLLAAVCWAPAPARPLAGWQVAAAVQRLVR